MGIAVGITVLLGCARNPLLGQDYPYTNAELLGQFNPAEHSAFVQIDRQYTAKSAIFLRESAYFAFQQMHEAALAEGIELRVISATRNYAAQEAIWNRKWSAPRFMGFEPLQRALEIMRFSSMPGASRHHWGTDIDINSLENSWFEFGVGARIYHWLEKHAAQFGYHQVYSSKKNGRDGYEEEKWHWSFMPLAAPMLQAYLTQITSKEFQGFSGAYCADSLQIIERYVQGIDTNY